MKKLQRWYVGQYNYSGAPDDYGDWCMYRDVAELEAQIKSLTEENERLTLLCSRYERIHNALQEAGVIS